MEGAKVIRVPHEDAGGFLNNACYILQARESVIPARVAIHGDILKQFKFDTELKDVEDTVLWIEIAAKYPLYFTSEATAVYNLHEDNSTNLLNNPFGNQLKGLRKIFSNPEISKLFPGSVKRGKLSTCYFGIARSYAVKENYVGMAFYTLRSIFADPFNKATLKKFKTLINIKPFLYTANRQQFI